MLNNDDDAREVDDGDDDICRDNDGVNDGGDDDDEDDDEDDDDNSDDDDGYDPLFEEETEGAIAGDDWEIAGLVLAFAGLGPIWEANGLHERYSVEHDLFRQCTSLEVASRVYDGGGPGSGGTFYVIVPDDEKAAIQELRDITARLIRANMDEVRGYRRAAILEEALRDAVHAAQMAAEALAAKYMAEVRRCALAFVAPMVGDAPPDPLISKIETGPWLKGVGSPVPDDATKACWLTVNEGIADFEVELFFRRIELQDELWIRHELGSGRVAWSPSADSVELSCARLVTAWMLNVGTWFYLNDFHGAKLVDAETLNDLYGAIQDHYRRERDAEKEQNGHAEIVMAAHRLGLLPRPSGEQRGRWQAQCAGRNHHLEIVPANGRFYCGYCKVGGNAAELEELVRSRRNA